MNLHKTLISALFLLGGFIGSSAETTLVVEMTDGTTHEYLSSENPKVTFVDEGVKVESDVLTAEYTRADFLRFTFKTEDKKEDVGIDNIINNANSSDTPSGKISVRYLDSNTIEASIRSNDSDAVCTLYNMQGHSIACEKLACGSAIISLSSLPKGLYILTISNQSIKIIKK